MTPPSCKTSPSKAAFMWTIFILLLTSITGTFGYCFDAIISFGDSFADTGNAVHFSVPPPPSASPPYGYTHFGKPTGRFSDGRLVIDFLAHHFGLPLVPPYFGEHNATKKDFGQGVNYAFGGATALNSSYLSKKGIHGGNNISLSTQLGWFNDMLKKSCPDRSSDDCKDLLRNSLFLLGGLGGNDLLSAVTQVNLTVVKSLLPDIIDTITSGVEELIERGAVNIMVAGQIPIGCVPGILAYANISKIQPTDYDNKTGCLRPLNDVTENYNRDLQDKLQGVQNDHSHANIIYADYYHALMQMYKSPKDYGIENPLDACCGGGGPNNLNVFARCGDEKATVCELPCSYVSWDGIHMTDKAYYIIAKALLEGPHTIPQIKSICPSPSKNGLADS